MTHDVDTEPRGSSARRAPQQTHGLGGRAMLACLSLGLLARCSQATSFDASDASAQQDATRDEVRDAGLDALEDAQIDGAAETGAVDGDVVDRPDSLVVAMDAAMDGGDPCALDRPLTRRSCAGGWELCFEGGSLPGHGGRPHEAWDNPVDDAWSREEFRRGEVLINQREGARTFLRSQRDARDAPSWMMRRDQFFTYETGMEMAVGIRVPASSEDRGVFVQYLDSRGGFALLVNATSLVFNRRPNYTVTSSSVAVPLPAELRGAFLELVLRKLPASNDVQIVAEWPSPDGGAASVQPFVAAGAGPLTTDSITQPDGFVTQWTIGDNNDLARGVYDLDYVRVRRHRAFLPVDRCGAVTPLPLPPRQRDDSHFIDGVGSAEAVGRVAGVRQTWSSFVPTAERCGMATGTVTDRTLTSRTTSSNTILCVYDNRLGFERGFTIEARVRRSTADLAGHLSWVEPSNAFTLRLEPTALVAHTYSKPVTTARYAAVLAMNAWHTVRVVRPARSQFAYVYLDNGPVPVISDWKSGAAPTQTGSGASSPRWAQISLGRLEMPDSPEGAWSTVGPLTGAGSAAGAMVADYVRWSTEALAP